MAAGRTPWAISCRFPGCAPIGSSIRRSSKRCTTPATALSLFDRLDFHPSTTDTLRLNVQAAQSGFDVPNTYDQIAQTQHQDITTFNIAPGYSRVIGSNALFTANGFVAPRPPHLYAQAPNPFDDTPATVSQDRTLTNMGVKADLSITAGNHNVKFGGSLRRDQAARAVHVRHHRSGRSGLCRRGRQLQPGVRAVRPDRRRIAAGVRPVVHRSSSRRPTSRTTSRPVTRRSSSASGSTTTTA